MPVFAPLCGDLSRRDPRPAPRRRHRPVLTGVYLASLRRAPRLVQVSARRAGRVRLRGRPSRGLGAAVAGVTARRRDRRPSTPVTTPFDRADDQADSTPTTCAAPADHDDTVGRSPAPASITKLPGCIAGRRRAACRPARSRPGRSSARSRSSAPWTRRQRGVDPVRLASSSWVCSCSSRRRPDLDPGARARLGPHAVPRDQRALR